MVNKALMSSVKDDWGTPQIIRSAVFEFADLIGKGVMDPCPGHTPVGTGMETLGRYHEPFDGLKALWRPQTEQQQMVYCNPPYGRAVRHWVQKATIEAAYDVDVVMLLAARTDTRWFHEAMRHARTALFVYGRLTFLGASAPAPFPSVLLYFGREGIAFGKAFGHLGTVVER